MTTNNIILRGICKKHGPQLILTEIAFQVRPGRVTAFLGPNGAGKSSTLRILLGLDHPLSGSATFGGIPYGQLKHPLKRVGAMNGDLQAFLSDDTITFQLTLPLWPKEGET